MHDCQHPLRPRTMKSRISYGLPVPGSCVVIPNNESPRLPETRMTWSPGNDRSSESAIPNRRTPSVLSTVATSTARDDPVISEQNSRHGTREVESECIISQRAQHHPVVDRRRPKSTLARVTCPVPPTINIDGVPVRVQFGQHAQEATCGWWRWRRRCRCSR